MRWRSVRYDHVTITPCISLNYNRFAKASLCRCTYTTPTCTQAKELYAEMVFLLRKMGDLNYALTLLVDKLQDFKVTLRTLRTY
jgi:hypothetical protein